MAEIEQTDIAGIAAFLRREDLVGSAAWQPMGLEGPVVACNVGDRVVGAARLCRTWLHPERWRLAIHVQSGSRRQGIGSALLAAVVAALPDADAHDLQAATGASDEIANAFLCSQGFDLLMTTRIGSLDADTVPDIWLRRHDADRLALAREGIEIVTLADAPDRMREVTMLHERIYRAQHAWNPPIELTAEQCVALFMNEDEWDAPMQLVAIRGGVAVGVGSLRRTDDANLLDFGWIGTVDMSLELHEPLCRALLGTCLASVRGQGMTVPLEIDAVDPEIDALIDELPVAWDDAWLTWRRGR